MTLQIADTHKTGVLTIRQDNEQLGQASMFLAHDEQRQLLETLARFHGFTLIDSQERRELLAHVSDAPPEPLPDEPWTRWPAAYKALAATVAAALRFENDREV